VLERLGLRQQQQQQQQQQRTVSASDRIEERVRGIG
jgi:hypothetical protein